MTDFSLAGQYQQNQSGPDMQLGGGGYNNMGTGEKPWYNDATWAGAVAGSVKGIFDYLNVQEQQRGARSLQNDRFTHDNNMVNSAVQRGSTMPLLQRFTKTKPKARA
jgi:hypothetical protein